MFEANFAAHVTRDAVRGLELFAQVQGNEGHYRFTISHAGADVLTFWAVSYQETLKPDEFVRLEPKNSPFIWMVFNWTKLDSDLIVEALRAFKAWHGSASRGTQFFIRIGPNGELLDG